jgi:hypothetical protein
MFLPFLFILLHNINMVGIDEGQGRISTEVVRGLAGRDDATTHGILVLVRDWNV